MTRDSLALVRRRDMSVRNFLGQIAYWLLAFLRTQGVRRMPSALMSAALGVWDRLFDELGQRRYGDLSQRGTFDQAS